MVKEMKTGEVGWMEEEADAAGGSGEGLFLKLVEGSNRVRIVSKPYKAYIHWVDDATGAPKKINCSQTGCPICTGAGGEGPKPRWFMRVLDRKTKKVKILEVGTQIYSQLKTLAKNPEWGNIFDFDIDVNRGKKGANPLYSVQPCPKKEPIFTEEEKAVITKAKAEVDLNKLVKPMTPDEINKILAGTPQANDLEEEEVVGAPAKGAAAASAASNFLDL